MKLTDLKPAVITIDTACDRYGLTPGRWAQLLRAGDVDGLRVGTTWLIRDASARAYATPVKATDDR